MRRAVAAFAGILAASAFLAACQTEQKSSGVRDNRAAISKLQIINARAQKCWVASKDKDFRQYRVIPELDTRAGKPRILIVNAKSTQGLPQYVIEADGTPARLSAYGPLSSEEIAKRINADVTRWEKGETACTA